MPRETTKVLLELPTPVVRDAKADAAQKGVTLKQWWAEAARAHLREREVTAAE